MNKCSEYVLDDLMAVTVIPVADGNINTQQWQLQPIIPGEGFSPTLTNAITVGVEAAVPGGMLVPIVRASGKAKDESQDSVSGRLHNVTVTCQADDRDLQVWNGLLALERTPGHLLLTFRGGTKGLVQADADTYLCTVSREGAKTSVSFRIQNIMGIQLIS